jgi:hypothetical protein
VVVPVEYIANNSVRHRERDPTVENTIGEEPATYPFNRETSPRPVLIEAHELLCHLREGKDQLGEPAQEYLHQHRLVGVNHARAREPAQSAGFLR